MDLRLILSILSPMILILSLMILIMVIAVRILRRREIVWGAMASRRMRRRLGATRVVEGYDSGVVCLSGFRSADAASATIHVWNPSRNLFWELPSPPATASDSSWRNATFKLGVGRDPSTGDLKVVRLCSSISSGPTCSFKLLRIFAAADTQVSVYSLRENSWRTVEWVPLVDPDLPGHTVMFSLCFRRYSVVVNSCIHWTAQLDWIPSDRVSTPRDCTWVTKFGIVAFDVATEAFRLVRPPREVTKLGVRDDLVEMFGRLALCVRDRERMDIWVMRHYGDSTSWTKQFSLNFSTFPFGGLYSGSKIEVANNGQAKIWTSWSVIDYDLITQTVLYFGQNPA